MQHGFPKITATDENGVAHKSWIGVSRGVLKTTVAGSFAAENWSNVLGQTTILLPPRTGGSRSSALRTEITMNPFGREIERDEPDQNTTKTVYDLSLMPIYVQEAADVDSSDFWATTYDGYCRVSRIGLEKDQSSWYTRIPTTPSTTYDGRQ